MAQTYQTRLKQRCLRNEGAQQMNIGDVSSRSGLPVKTIRYYEDIGLVSPPRGSNGYRRFREQELHKLSFLGRARSLGFTIEDCCGNDHSFAWCGAAFAADGRGDLKIAMPTTWAAHGPTVNSNFGARVAYSLYDTLMWRLCTPDASSKKHRCWICSTTPCTTIPRACSIPCPVSTARLTVLVRLKGQPPLRMNLLQAAGSSRVAIIATIPAQALGQLSNKSAIPAGSPACIQWGCHE